jgi:hypothetical protein
VAGYAFKAIESLRHLPPGNYLVTDSPEIGKGNPRGQVTIKRKWFTTMQYTTTFTPFQKEGGLKWEGEIESKFRMMCEGVWRYRDNYACGTSTVTDNLTCFL